MNHVGPMVNHCLPIGTNRYLLVSSLPMLAIGTYWLKRVLEPITSTYTVLHGLTYG